MTLVRDTGGKSGTQNKKFPLGNFGISDGEIVFLDQSSAKLSEQIGLLDLFLLQVIDRFDFVNHFGVAGSFFDAGLDEVLQEFLQLEEPKHFDNAATEIRVKESVFPEGVKGPVNCFLFFLVAAVNNEAIRAGFAQWFSGISATVENENSLIGGWTVD